jgi:DNA repair protein REV1
MFVTHIIASNLTPKKRVEFERYKVVRPDWIVDCVKAGKTLPWNNYRLITHSSQKTIGLMPQVAVDGYRTVSSREETVILGGGGLRTGSQESSSYPTPPEMKSPDLNSDEVGIKEEAMDDSGEKMLIDEVAVEADRIDEASIAISLPKPAETITNDGLQIPSTLSSIQISSPPGQDDNHLPSPPKRPPSPSILPPQTLETSSINDPAADPREQVKDPPAIDEHNTPQNLLIDPESPNAAPKQDIAAISAAHNATILANPSLRPHTAVDPSFLKSYFDQSRLHHLSTWKADLKAQMQQLTSQHPLRPRKIGADRWILHVDFDCFFCSVSLLSRPELKDKPVCVGHGGAGSGEIASCNYPARKFGIRNAML